MFDSKKRKSRFREKLEQTQQNGNLSTDFELSVENLSLTFGQLLTALKNSQEYDLDLETCVELVDLLLFDEKNAEKSTISRLREKYEGYSDFMLSSYMELGLDPNDNLMQNLVEFDLKHGFTVDQLVTSGWFYYRNWRLNESHYEIVTKSNEIWDIMHKVVVVNM